MPKKKANALPWILGNNPNQDNSCQCFKKKLPNPNWIAVKRYATEDECTQDTDACSELFMKAASIIDSSRSWSTQSS